MSLVVYATTTEVAYRVRDEQLTGTLEMLCAQPLRPVELAFGFTAFPLAFAVARASSTWPSPSSRSVSTPRMPTGSG